MNTRGDVKCIKFQVVLSSHCIYFSFYDPLCLSSLSSLSLSLSLSLCVCVSSPPLLPPAHPPPPWTSVLPLVLCWELLAPVESGAPHTNSHTHIHTDTYKREREREREKEREQIWQ